MKLSCCCCCGCIAVVVIIGGNGTIITYGGEVREEANKIVKTGKVPVFVIAQLPLVPVIDLNVGWQWTGLCEIDQPNVRMGIIVYQQQ